MKRVRGDVWRASCVSISVAVLAAAMVVALPGCRDGSGGIGQAPPRLGEPVTSADHLSVLTVLVRGPVVQRVTADGVSVLGKPVKSLVNEEITVTVTPDGGKRVSATGRFDEKRDTFVVRVSGLPANTVCSYEVSVGGMRRALAECWRVLAAPGTLLVTVTHPTFIQSLSKRGLLRRRGKGVMTLPGAGGLRLPVVTRSQGEYERLLRQSGFRWESEYVFATPEVLNAKPGLREAGNIPLALLFSCTKACMPSHC